MVKSRLDEDRFPGGQELPIGTVRFRKDKCGKKRAYVKIGRGQWKLRSHVVWEREHGRPVPYGYNVHHENEDTLDDSPSNLKLLTFEEHGRLHNPKRSRRFWKLIAEGH